MGQCLTSSKAETSKNCGPKCSQNDLFYSNIVKRPLKLAFYQLKSINCNTFLYYGILYYYIYMLFEFHDQIEWKIVKETKKKVITVYINNKQNVCIIVKIKT